MPAVFALPVQLMVSNNWPRAVARLIELASLRPIVVSPKTALSNRVGKTYVAVFAFFLVIGVQLCGFSGSRLLLL